MTSEEQKTLSDKLTVWQSNIDSILKRHDTEMLAIHYRQDALDVRIGKVAESALTPLKTAGFAIGIGLSSGIFAFAGVFLGHALHKW